MTWVEGAKDSGGFLLYRTAELMDPTPLAQLSVNVADPTLSARKQAKATS